jgi:hypothetical protein
MIQAPLDHDGHHAECLHIGCPRAAQILQAPAATGEQQRCVHRTHDRLLRDAVVGLTVGEGVADILDGCVLGCILPVREQPGRVTREDAQLGQQRDAEIREEYPVAGFFLAVSK